VKKLGKYELLKEIGQGDFTTDYQARDTQIGRLVTLSVYTGDTNKSGSTKDDLAKPFINDARITAGLFHPHLAPVYDLGHADGKYFRTTRLIQGLSLRQLLERQKRLPLEQALVILTQVAEVLDFLESKAILCGNLEPAAVMLEGDPAQPSVCLTNLRLSRQESGGKPGHGRHVDLMITLAFEVLAGRPPFQGELTGPLFELDHEQPAPPPHVEQSLDDDLVSLLLAGKSSLPADRYTTSGAFVAALSDVAKARQEGARQVPRAEQLIALARTAYEAGDWLSVQALTILALQQDQNRVDVLVLMAEVTAALLEERAEEARHRQMGSWYQEADQALAAGNWAAALAASAKVAQVDPNFRDIQDKMAQAARGRKLAQWHEEAMSAAEGGEHGRACRLLLNLLTDEPNYRDGEALQHLLASLNSFLGQTVLSEEPARVETQPSPVPPFKFPPDRETGVTESDQAASQQVGTAGGRTASGFPANPDQAVAWLDRLNSVQTQTLDNDNGPRHLANNEPPMESIQATQWANGKTKRLQGPLHNRLKSTSKAPGGPDATTAWLERIASLQTRQLSPDEVPSPSPESSISAQKATIWPKDGKEMVLVPQGPFGFGVEEQPTHVEEFWIDKTPVTNAEYKVFLDANPAHPVPHDAAQEAEAYNWHEQSRTYPDGLANHPVVLVSWMDAEAYAAWAGKRLPTEEEWEKAARGVDGRKYPWGNKWQSGLANTQDGDVGGTCEVGGFSPAGDSPFGVVDMCGNVWEWTATEFSSTTKVLRGGSWRNSSFDANCVWRSRSLPATVAPYIGFRLVSSTRAAPPELTGR
jgi:formylglycine-generating enzyme required for sulfatase activity